MRQVYDETQKLAVELASFGDHEAGAGMLRLAEVLAFAAKADKQASTLEGLEPLGSGGSWAPPHNLVAKFSARGFGLWTFSILPYFPVKRAYREDLNSIVIRPAWRPMPLEVNTRHASEAFPKYPTISTTVDKELSWLEKQFSIEVPADIRAVLVAASLDQARQRWGADPTRIKDRLIPLDGALPRDTL
jgi:hypothetical protein